MNTLLMPPAKRRSFRPLGWLLGLLLAVSGPVAHASAGLSWQRDPVLIQQMVTDAAGLQWVPGEPCFIPRGVVHHHTNLGTETATVLTMLTPASIGPAYFRELSALLQAGGPPDSVRVQEIMATYGLVVA